MEIISGEEGKILVLGGVRVPLNDMLGEVVDAVKNLNLDQHVAMARGAGLEVPDLMLTDEYAQAIGFVAMSFAQQAWYQANQGEGPYLCADGSDVSKKHESRVAKFKELVVAAKAKPVEVKKPLGPVGEAKHRLKLPDLPTARHDPKPLGDGVIAITLDGSIMLTLSAEVKDIDVDNPALAEALLHTAGYDVPGGMPFENLRPLAIQVAKRYWYESFGIRPATSEDFDYEQKLLSKQFAVLAAKHKKKALKNYDTAVDNGELGDEPVKPKEPRSPKPARITKVVIFRLTPDVPRPIIDAIRGQSKIVYDAVAEVAGQNEGDAAIEKVVFTAEAKGFKTNEPAGNAPRIRWLALELVKKGILATA